VHCGRPGKNETSMKPELDITPKELARAKDHNAQTPGREALKARYGHSSKQSRRQHRHRATQGEKARMTKTSPEKQRWTIRELKNKERTPSTGPINPEGKKTRTDGAEEGEINASPKVEQRIRFRQRSQKESSNMYSPRKRL